MNEHSPNIARITGASKVKTNYGNNTMENEKNSSDSKAHPVDTLVMCIDEHYFDGDPASPEDTIVRFVDAAGDTVCKMEFYSDQECATLYEAVLRYATRMGIEKKYTSNVNNHYYT